MPRPNKPKCVQKLPICQTYYPAGKENSCHEIVLSVEEYETLRLLDYQGMTQAQCARQMGIARATVQSLYTEARKKTARFLVEGAGLCIRGGNFCIEEPKEKNGSEKGVFKMKIAVTYENGEVFQHFGHTEQFKIYEVADGKITSAEVVDTNGQGHGALGGFLAEAGVNVLICGGIGGGARNALAAAGIQLFGGACGDADEQVKSFLAGNLAYDPNVECQHHGEGHHGEGHDCGGHGNEGGCGNHGCH